MKAPATLYLLILCQDVWYLLLDIWKLLQQSDRNWCFLWCCVCVCVCVCRGARGYSLSFAGIWDTGVSSGVSCPREGEHVTDWEESLNGPALPDFCSPQSEEHHQTVSRFTPLPLLCFLKACGVQMDMCVGFWATRNRTIMHAYS